MDTDEPIYVPEHCWTKQSICAYLHNTLPAFTLEESTMTPEQLTDELALKWVRDYKGLALELVTFLATRKRSRPVSEEVVIEYQSKVDNFLKGYYVDYRVSRQSSKPLRLAAINKKIAALEAEKRAIEKEEL